MLKDCSLYIKAVYKFRLTATYSEIAAHELQFMSAKDSRFIKHKRNQWVENFGLKKSKFKKKKEAKFGETERKKERRTKNPSPLFRYKIKSSQIELQFSNRKIHRNLIAKFLT